LNNNRFEALPPYPFPRVRALLDHITPEDTSAALNMTIGEPQHAIPGFVADVLAENVATYHKYPPPNGTADWIRSVSNWIIQRFGLSEGAITADHIVPLSGSKEGLFGLGQVVIPESKQNKKPLVLTPNPFYQPYAGSAVSGGADIVYVNAIKENNFLPDYEALDEEVLDRTAMAFICSPANPQGTVASLDYLKRLILLARKHDFVIVGDECYSEIYDDQAPDGILKAAEDLVADGKGNAADPFRNVVCFNSLSKRSNLAGLRSGFMAGDPEIAAQFRKIRAYGGAPMPIPVYAASAAAWDDEDHVIANRALYRKKFDLAEQYLGGRFDFFRPQGGFCMWLNVGDGEQACEKLWRTAGIRVLPGGYLANADAYGFNPGLPYIRLVLVHDEKLLEPALEKIAATL